MAIPGDNETAGMGCQEIAEYLDRQKQKGWPGSKSIHPGRYVLPLKPAKQPVDDA